MKKIIYMAILALIGTFVFADEIFLKDGGSIKGKVIQITETSIEIDPEGARAFDIIDKNKAVKIVYDNGQVKTIQTDTLYRIDGTAIRGKVIKVSRDNIIYSLEGSAEQKAVPRSEFSRIEYADGKVVYLISKSEAPEEIIHEVKKQSGGFIDSWVRIAGFMSFGSPFDGVFDRERRLFRAYEPDLFIAYVMPRDYNTFSTLTSGGGEIDFMPPSIKFVQKRGFDFTGIKFGVRARYGYELIDSVIVDEDDYYSTVEGYELFRGKFMDYHYWTVGPVMDLIFSPRSNSFNLIINFYATAGQVLGGRLRAGAALRNARFLVPELAGIHGAAGPFMPEIALIATRFFNKANFSGYTVRIGFGPHISMNRYFPVIFGLNVTYAYTNITMGRAPLAYFDGNRKSGHHEAGAEISAGVHL